jgi:hypothetical protein
MANVEITSSGILFYFMVVVAIEFLGFCFCLLPEYLGSFLSGDGGQEMNFEDSYSENRSAFPVGGIWTWNPRVPPLLHWLIFHLH